MTRGPSLDNIPVWVLKDCSHQLRYWLVFSISLTPKQRYHHVLKLAQLFLKCSSALMWRKWWWWSWTPGQSPPHLCCEEWAIKIGIHINNNLIRNTNSGSLIKNLTKELPTAILREEAQAGWSPHSSTRALWRASSHHESLCDMETALLQTGRFCRR